MAETKKVSRVKVKKKTWFKLLAPKLFGQQEIGETYLNSPAEAKGRLMKFNLKELTGNVKDQNVYLQFQIGKASGTNLETSVVGYHLTPSYIKRMVRKNTSRLDDYFTAKTKDGKEVIVKGLMVTLRKVQRSNEKRLRKLFKESLGEEISKSDFPTIVGNLVNAKIKFDLKKKLNKVYPLREVAVRVLVLKRATKTEDLEEAKAEPKEEKKEKPAKKSTEEKPAPVNEEKKEAKEEKAPEKEETK